MSSYPGMSILVLEDDDDCRHAACSILKSAGFKVIGACDFNEAIGFIEDGVKIDLALIDVKMPAGTPNGVSFARMAQLRNPALKLVFMSACISPEDLTIFDKDDVFLRKPFIPQHLLEAVTRAAA